MKRYLSAILSLIIAVTIVSALASCGKTDNGSDEATIDTATIGGDVPAALAKIPVTTSEDEQPSTSAPQKSKPDTYEIDSKLQKMLEKKLKDMNFSGVARVSKNGKVICEAAYGKLSSKSSKKIKVDTPFAIASCSKQITAGAVMILKDDGKLKVSDKLSKYFPKYKYGKQITVKNLLAMRSGIPDFLNDSYSFSKYDISKKASTEKNCKITEKWIFSHDLKFTPDGAYDYSNSNYFLLARIVEKVSGMTFAEFLRERIFYPLEMYNTDVNENLAYSKKLAVSDIDYYDLPGISESKQPLTIRVKGLNVGNGGLISTASDMDKWLTSLREYTIISEKSVKEMTKDYSPYSEHYGYGLQVNKDGSVWHVGALDYYASYSYTIPKKGYNFFAVTNDKKSMNCDIYTFASSIINSTK